MVCIMRATPPACRGNGPVYAIFRNAEEAWFWTIRALRARATGEASSGAGLGRPCDPDDIILCLERLYNERRIDGMHARVLRRWGDRQIRPPASAAGGEDLRLWREAIAMMAPKLRAKQIAE
jgi:hypothetical protein